MDQCTPHKGRPPDLLEGHGYGSNGMVVGAPLQRWEHSKVDSVLKSIRDLLASLGVYGPHSLPVKDES